MEKSKVLQKIDDKINEIFLECQEELNIKYGDISPDEAFKLEELEEKLYMISDNFDKYFKSILFIDID